MRYYKNKIFKNKDKSYSKYLKSRGKKDIIQFETSTLKHPTVEDTENFNVSEHIWKLGDRYFKLADQFYNDATKWWVIALYNRKPTESHVQVGDIVYIPYPLEDVLYYMGY